jgi:lipopolysaccharide transport system ATP-binding protein
VSDIAVKIENLTKVYRLYDDPVDRLKESLHPLRKVYHRDFFALNDVSFEIVKGETVGIIGRNGAGKSTLLKILTGVLTPTHGQVLTSGKVLALLELGAGFNPELTGVENVYFNGALLGASRKEMDEKLDAILDFADIGEFIHQPVKTYSSGMYVRLAFAVIANMDADVIIVDEALSVGDAFFVQKCMRFLRKFIEHGTLVFVSHDTGAVLNLCDRAVWLHDGTVHKDGHPKDVTEAYLADLYEAQQGASAVAVAKQGLAPETSAEPRDMRLDFVNATSLRNDIELFEFKDDGLSFGKRGASIESITLLDNAGAPLSWVVGGEEVSLTFQCRVKEHLQNPILGFIVKDRLGQSVFADNTFLVYADRPVPVAAGQALEAQFSFRMPVMPVGDYSISVAVAEGTQQEHIQHQWINDALIFKVHSSSVCLGLMGVPMKEIELIVRK